MFFKWEITSKTSCYTQTSDGSLKAWILFYPAHPPDHNGYVWEGGYDVRVDFTRDGFTYSKTFAWSSLEKPSVYCKSLTEAKALAEKFADKLSKL